MSPKRALNKEKREELSSFMVGVVLLTIADGDPFSVSVRFASAPGCCELAIAQRFILISRGSVVFTFFCFL